MGGVYGDIEGMTAHHARAQGFPDQLLRVHAYSGTLNG